MDFGDLDNLLDFGTIDVYHIVLKKNNSTYYLLDMTEDVHHIKWTTNHHDALYFYTESEALKHSRVIKASRPGAHVAPGKINLIEDLNSEDF